MKKVKVDFVTILSTCQTCKKADETVRRVLEGYGSRVDLNHVDMGSGSEEEIGKLKKEYGILMTPFIAINGRVFTSGKSPGEDELRKAIEGELE